jgi:hypothetical protein
LANPHFLDWRQSGQNPENWWSLYLQRCRTAGAILTFDIRHSSF